MVQRFSFQLNRRLSALTRRRVGLSLQDGELWAGEMLRPAGFSAGRGTCARGGCSARRGNSGLGAGRFAVIHAGACGSIAVFCRRFTPVFFPLSGKKRRLAISCVSIPPGRDRHSCVLAALFGYLPLWVHFGLARFFMAIPTENEGTRRTESAARRKRTFARAHRLCHAFRGEYVGAARPKPAPKSLRLSGLSSRCGGVGLMRIRAVARAHGKTRPSPIYARAGRAV